MRSPRRPQVPPAVSPWDPVESDTESLAQERACQQWRRLRPQADRRGPSAKMLLEKEAGDRSQGDGEDAVEDAGDEELLAYDSLEVAAEQPGSPDARRDEGEAASQPPSIDAYSDLRYDPNWRTNLEEGGCFAETPQGSVEGHRQIPGHKSGQSWEPKIMKGGYRRITDPTPAVVVTPHAAGNECDQPYHLHPPASPIRSPSRHNNQSLQRPMSPSDRSRSPSVERDSALQVEVRRKRENDWESASPERVEEVYAMYLQRLQKCHQQAQRRTHGRANQSTSRPEDPQVLSKGKPERLTEDIVERNKVTLGRRAGQHGSYARAHARKQEAPRAAKEVHGDAKEAPAAGSPSEPREPEKTQQLQVAQISKGKKAQRTKIPCLSLRRKPPDHQPQPAAWTATSSQPLPPTIQLNINLNNSSHPLSFIQQNAQDSIINLTSLQGHAHLFQQRNPGKSCHMCPEGPNAERHHTRPEKRLEQWQSPAAFEWPINANVKQFAQNPTRTPTTATTTSTSKSSGHYSVLPPIGQPAAEKAPGLTCGQTSGGYLAQMERQRQQRARTTYKAYSVKDYKKLVPNTNLGGLGPDYNAIEKTAEKMKRQKLYSNVIREQNKMISRIPFPLAKDPEGNGKKVPRTRALEYARTISRPPVQPQPKPSRKQRSEDPAELLACFQDLDISQMNRLQLLRERHEEEKRVLALLRRGRGVSGAPAERGTRQPQ